MEWENILHNGAKEKQVFKETPGSLTYKQTLEASTPRCRRRDEDTSVYDFYTIYPSLSIKG